jgi:hypothetical protein
LPKERASRVPELWRRCRIEVRNENSLEDLGMKSYWKI